jgi:hypothetical protein
VHRQLARECAILEPETAPRNAQPARADPLGEMRDRPGSERDVDVRVEVEQSFALRLRVAAADRDHRLGIRVLQRLRLGKVRREALVRLLADRARVEDDHVGFGLRRRLAEPERLEHPLDSLRVVGVHLAPERRDVVALHGSSTVATRDVKSPSENRCSIRPARLRDVAFGPSRLPGLTASAGGFGFPSFCARRPWP